MIEIRCDTTPYYIHLDRIHEWSASSWTTLMSRMVKGGELNQEAAETLAEWFPHAMQTAASRYNVAQKTYDARHRSYRGTPRAQWETQKEVNEILAEEVRQARRQKASLEIKYKHFLAAKASMKKEN